MPETHRHRMHTQRTVTHSVMQTAMNKALPSTAPTRGTHVKHKYSWVSASFPTGRALCSLMKALPAPLCRFTSTHWFMGGLAMGTALLPAQHPCPQSQPSHQLSGPLLAGWCSWMHQIRALTQLSLGHSTFWSYSSVQLSKFTLLGRMFCFSHHQMFL